MPDPVSKCTRIHHLWGDSWGFRGLSAPICPKGGQGKLHQCLSSKSLAKLPTQTLGKALEELQESTVLWDLRWFHPKGTFRKFIFRAGFPHGVEPGLREAIPTAQQIGVGALQSLQAGPSAIKNCSSGWKDSFIYLKKSFLPQECARAPKNQRKAFPKGRSDPLELSRAAVAAALPSLHSWFHSEPAASAELGVFRFRASTTLLRVWKTAWKCLLVELIRGSHLLGSLRLEF